MTLKEMQSEQDRLYEKVKPYCYINGIDCFVQDDAPKEIKQAFKRMRDMTPEIRKLEFLYGYTE